ncbi:hypothetical protein HU200_017016 [Digitaria exilis]|uniref:beta-galactosidase n=1 Tax=Digitaria exilis TaxID=1010633 RepID=A0A835F7L9_9POAL|nr:hypothetical protein HU200_017016 [Digitaria exilis]
MESFTTLIVNKMKDAEMFAGQGGPIILAQIYTCNGFYCHDWFPNRTGIPKIWTENWTGWFKAWDKPDFHRSAEDIAFAVAMFFQKRGSVQNYYMLETPVKLQSGKNYISLLSGTVGLKNYGPLFELMPAGIAGGPVKLMGTNGTSIDLTNSTWSYKSGLAGEQRQLHLNKAGHKWRSHNGSIPVNRPFTWYKTTFAAPAGEEAVVVDLWA